MKAKLIFIIILGLVLFGVLMMTYGQTTPADIVGAAIILLGGGVAVFDCLKQRSEQYEQAIAFIPPFFKIATIGHIENSDVKSLPNDTILHEKDIAYQHEKAGHRHILCLTLNKP